MQDKKRIRMKSKRNTKEMKRKRKKSGWKKYFEKRRKEKKTYCAIHA